MKKGFRKLLTFLLVFSMIAGMGVSFGANDGSQGILNIKFNAELPDGVTLIMTPTSGPSIEFTNSGSMEKDIPKATYTISFTSTGYPISDFLVVGKQANDRFEIKPDQRTITFVATVQINQVTVVFREPKVTINYESANTTMGTVSPADETIKETTGTAAGSTATPTSSAYRFVNWKNGDTIVSTDATFTPAKVEGKNVAATYTAYFEEVELPPPPPGPGPTEVERFTVTFVDFDGTVIKTQRVNRGNSATPPGNPTRAGWNFREWDGNWTNVRRDETVVARYTELEIEVIEEPPVPEAPPVVVPPVVEVPAEPVPQSPVLPKTGTFGAGEAAGIGALLMAIGLLIRKKKDA